MTVKDIAKYLYEYNWYSQEDRFMEEKQKWKNGKDKKKYEKLERKRKQEEERV